MDIAAAVNELIKLAEKTQGKLNKHVVAARDAMKPDAPAESQPDSAVESAPESLTPESDAV